MKQKELPKEIIVKYLPKARQQRAGNVQNRNLDGAAVSC